MGIVNAVTQGDVGRLAMRAGVNTVLDLVRNADTGVRSANDLHRRAVLPLLAAVDAHRATEFLTAGEVAVLDGAVIRLRGSLPRIGQGVDPAIAAARATSLLDSAERSLRSMAPRPL